MSDPLASPVPVAGSDAEILRYLSQVVAIGQHKGTWSSADVVRISEAHLRHPHTLRRQLLNERAARGRAEEEINRLRAKIRQLTAIQGTPVAGSPFPRPVVELTPKRYAVLELLMEGATRKQIAERLALSPASVYDRIHRLKDTFGVKRMADVLTLMHNRQVEVRVLDGYRAA